MKSASVRRVAARWLRAKGFSTYPEQNEPDEDTPDLDSWRTRPDVDLGDSSALPGDEDEDAENDGRGWQWNR